MKLVHYADAKEVTHGEDWSVSVTNFYCINDQLHVSRKMMVNKKTALPATETWSRPSLCDGSCSVWKGKLLGMPEETKQACKKLAHAKPQQ
jgi:hypothetical protein